MINIINSNTFLYFSHKVNIALIPTYRYFCYVSLIYKFIIGFYKLRAILRHDSGLRSTREPNICLI